MFYEHLLFKWIDIFVFFYSYVGKKKGMSHKSAKSLKKMLT